MQEMTLRQQLGEPLASEQVITLFNLLEAPEWHLMFSGESWDLKQLIDGQAGYVEAFNLTGQGDLTSAELMLETEINELHQELPSLKLTSHLNTDDLSNWLIDSRLRFDDAGKIDVSGTVDITNRDNPQLALTGRWQSLNWPVKQKQKLVDS